MNEDGENPSLNYAEGTLLLRPYSDQRQSINNLNTFSSLSAEIFEEDSIIFRWEEYAEEVEFGYTSIIETQRRIYQLPYSRFPILDLKEEEEYYLEEGEKIDITPEILAKANEIVEGESNLYTAVFKLANWVEENIEYDLNTITADAALSSSWVLENREGVCDELTALFISLSRSVGIPAKFIAGTAYSNSNEGFGNHGWAEVYFPGKGWVPYDVTFKQFGFIDPAHIKLLENLDSSSPSIQYNWRSNNIVLLPQGLNITTRVLEEGDRVSSPFDMRLRALKNNVRPGSYVPIKVTIENPFENYTSNTAIITKAPGMTEDNLKPVLLKPNQEKSIFWIIEIPEDVEPNMIYTTQIEVKDLFGNIKSKSIEFSAGNDYEFVSLEEAEEIIGELEELEEKTYSEEISLRCESNKSYYYVFEQIPLTCKVRNIGNKILNDFSVCLEGECRIIDLTISEEKEISFETLVENKTELIVSANNGAIDLINNVPVLILDMPDLRMTAFEYPTQVNYSESFNWSFELTSEALVKNLEIHIKGMDHYVLNQSQGIHHIGIESNSRQFLNNQIFIGINFEDEYGNKFDISEIKYIEVMNLPWYASLYKFFIDLIN